MKTNDIIEIKIADFEPVKKALQVAEVAVELIEMYQQAIRETPNIPEGFCEGVLFQEKLKILEDYSDKNE